MWRRPAASRRNTAGLGALPAHSGCTRPNPARNLPAVRPQPSAARRPAAAAATAPPNAFQELPDVLPPDSPRVTTTRQPAAGPDATGATTSAMARARAGRLLRRPLAAAALLALAVLPAAAQVGMATLQVGDLPVTLVYPSTTPTRPVVMGPFTLQVAPEGAPAAGPFRLVLMSHGTGGSPITDHDQAATLARAGFVVAQPLHGGDNFRDSSRAGPSAWATRTAELVQVIDALAAHPQWQARLQLDKVGVHGMSAGGGTALTLAGGQWSTLLLARHCNAAGDADLGFCFNGLADAAAQAPRRQQFASLRDVPEAHLPPAVTALQGGRSVPPGADPRPDARVASVSAAVPVAAMFSSESLARIQLPVGLVTAGADTMLPEAFHAGRVLKECPRCERIAHLPGAAHMDLLSPLPPAVAEAEAARQPRGGAPAAGFDARERQAAFEAVAAFHRRHLAPLPAGMAR